VHAESVPPVVIVTSEFDYTRKPALRTRDYYENMTARNNETGEVRKMNKVAAFLNYGGGYHMSYNNVNLKEHD